MGLFAVFGHVVLLRDLCGQLTTRDPVDVGECRRVKRGPHGEAFREHGGQSNVNHDASPLQFTERYAGTVAAFLDHRPHDLRVWVHSSPPFTFRTSNPKPQHDGQRLRVSTSFARSSLPTMVSNRLQ